MAPAGSIPTVLVVQHLEPEEPFAIADALVTAGCDVVVRRADLDRSPFPTAAGLSGLVVMGGPMSAYSDEGFPTRARERALIADCLRANVPVLGVCLGAQLLAVAAGGRVYAGTRGREIGWGPVRLEPAAGADALFAGCPAEIVVLHWHGDTYSLPPGAVHLASSPRYAQQAFRVGTRAWGVQFHIEMDAAAVEGIARAFPEDADESPGGMDALLAATPGAAAALAPVRDLVLGRFASLCARAK